METHQLETTIAIPMNDVFSPDFKSQLNEHFLASFDPSYKWAPGARARPRLVELGMLWDQKETKKGRGI